MNIVEKTMDHAKQLAYSNIAKFDVSKIVFEESLRTLCESNSCGKFGTNWGCPPGCGTPEDLKNQISEYQDGIILQKIYTLSDSFDFEGMQAGNDDFDQLFYQMLDFVDKENPKRYFAMKAGDCDICETCTYPDSPCVHPNKAKPSLEACCIDVTSLCKVSGINYINGKNTVSYVSAILF
jgi:predicted metal-binding protein